MSVQYSHPYAPAYINKIVLGKAIPQPTLNSATYAEWIKKTDPEVGQLFWGRTVSSMTGSYFSIAVVPNPNGPGNHKARWPREEFFLRQAGLIE